MEFHDRISIERVKRLGDGRLAAVARFARSGVYRYAGSEVGRPDLASVNVYRPEDEVFAEDAMASFAHKAITLDHPAEPVTAANWSKVSVGYTEGRVARDGGFVEIPLMLADADAVKAVQSGAMKELSAGYTCQLVWGDGVAPDGTAYQAKQVGIRGNHIALVAAGRAGPECRVGDSAARTDSQDLLRLLTGRRPMSAAEHNSLSLADTIRREHDAKVTANNAKVQAMIDAQQSKSRAIVDSVSDLSHSAAVRDAARAAAHGR